LESHAKRIYAATSAIGELGVISLAEKIRGGLLPNPFTVRDVYRRHWSRLDTPARAKAAADELAELNWLGATETVAGGRPKTTYQINPKVAV
jgi:putative DNA primase/helicase